MTLTFDLDLDIHPPDLHAKIQVRMSVHSAMKARHTDRRKDGQTERVKTITPIMS